MSNDTKRVSLRAYACHRKDRGLPGGTLRAVQKAIEDGRIAKAVGDDGLIDVALADSEWAKNTDPGYQNGAGSKKHRAGRSADADGAQPDPTSLVEARRMLTLAKAAQADIDLQNAQLDLEERLQNVITRKAHRRELVAFAEAAAATIRSIPNRWANDLAGLDAQETRASLKRLVNDLLTELSQNDRPNTVAD